MMGIFPLFWATGMPVAYLELVQLQVSYPKAPASFLTVSFGAVGNGSVAKSTMKSEDACSHGCMKSKMNYYYRLASINHC